MYGGCQKPWLMGDIETSDNTPGLVTSLISGLAYMNRTTGRLLLGGPGKL